MIRREFITLLGGAAAAWPLVARVRSSRPFPWSDTSAAARPNSEELLLSSFRKGLEEEGFTIGWKRRLARLVGGSPQQFRACAREHGSNSAVLSP